MAFTSDQLKAINTRGGNILVSAAAGSGKTAVLTERIITYLKNGGSVERLLVVTFTNLAATEMKERIKKALIKEELFDQLALIDNSKIMTMDAFYKRILNENALKFKINPKFELIDSSLLEIYKKEAIKKVIENNMDTTFLDNFYNIKGVSVGEDVIISFTNFISKMPFREKYLEQLKNNFFNNNIDETIFAEFMYNELYNIVKSFINIYLEKQEECLYSSKLSNLIDSDLSILNNILTSVEAKKYDKIRASFNFEFMRFPVLKEDKDDYVVLELKELRNVLKGELKKYSVYFSLDSNNAISLINKQGTIINSMINYSNLYLNELDNLKGDFKTFDDISANVLKMLVEDYDFEKDEVIKTKLALEISLEFDEILIDEYQDTNMMQDLIFRAISNNNLFVVGDIKQSIYGFRGSEPGIMTKLKNTYNQDSFPMLITLSKNFRSRGEILDFTNFVFENIMTNNYGMINYDKDEFLYLGANYEANDDVKIHVSVLNEEAEDKDDIKNDIKEANYVASCIKDLVSNGVNPRDIAILIRDANSKAMLYKTALEARDISVYTSSSKIYFDQYEIDLMIALLKAIVIKDKLSLVAVLRSPLFDFDEQTIYDNREDFEFLIKEKLDKYRSEMYNYSISSYISYLYNDLDVFNKLSKLDNSKARIKNLLDLIGHAEDFMKRSNSLLLFVKYLSELVKQDLSLDGANPSPDNDSVLITSIHKSKGLQFKYVFMPTLSKKFNTMDMKSNIIFNKDYYLGFNLKDNEELLFNKEVIKLNERNNLIWEEMRILYVGLTRACEYLYLSFTTSKFYQKCENVLNLTSREVNYLYLKNVNSYMDLLLPVILKSPSSKDVLTETMGNYKFLPNAPLFDFSVIKINDVEIIEKAQVKDNNLVKNEFVDVSKFKVSDKVISTSVTESKKQNISFFDFNEGLNVGTTYHKFLEEVDFINYDSNEVDNITFEFPKLKAFFNSEFYKNVLVNSIIKKEEDISFVVDSVLYEGIIDLLAIYEDVYYIIDYKSDNISVDELVLRYKDQLDLYGKAFDKRVCKYIYSIYNECFILVE